MGPAGVSKRCGSPVAGDRQASTADKKRHNLTVDDTVQVRADVGYSGGCDQKM